MIKVDYLLVCEDVRVDDSNRPTIVNVADQLNVPQVPAGLRGAKVTFRFHPTTKAIVNKSMNFKIVADLDGERAWTAEAAKKITVEKNNGYAEVLSVDPMVFPKFGLYQIKLLIDDKEMAVSLLRVRDIAELTEQ